MKLFIMGAGYVGMALLDYLHYPKDSLYISTTNSEKVSKLQEYSEHIILLKPLNFEVFKKAVDECDGMVIMVAPKKHENYAETYLGMAKLVTKALEGRQNPFYLLYTSSTGVYEGIQNENSVVNEELNLNPGSENAKVLVETEKLYLECADTCILRLGGIYGPGRELANRAKRFSGIEMSGTGFEHTNHIHLDDIISAIAFSLDQHLAGVYNLVNNAHPTRKELYSGLCKTLKLPLPKWKEGHANNGYRVENGKIIKAGYKFIHEGLNVSYN